MMSIGKTSNYYGGVMIKEEDNKYYWIVEDYKEQPWEEIPEYLYYSLLTFEKTRIFNLKHEINT